VQAPNGSKTVSGGPGDYAGVLSASGNFFSAGTITVSTPGGADVPAFSTSIALPAFPTMTSPQPDAPIAYGQALDWPQPEIAVRRFDQRLDRSDGLGPQIKHEDPLSTAQGASNPS